MEAVYKLLNVDRGIPEVFASAYDIRVLLNLTHILWDKKKINDIQIPLILKIFRRGSLKKIKGTFLEELLEKSGLL